MTLLLELLADPYVLFPAWGFVIFACACAFA